jgi:wyosine [tRNA(Phe)-imidazoG37] synthetase (radical SAM superfamily)
VNDILIEVQNALMSHKMEDIDWITFVGSGETTLHAELGWLVKQVKMLTRIPVAVITNGSLLYEPTVRKALQPADAVLPSLDAGTAALYKKINRPHPGISFEKYIEGLMAFRQIYFGRLWLEVMLLKDVNDTEEALKDIAAVIEKVRPDKVHIGLPTRPPAEAWVKPLDDDGIMRATAILGYVAQVVHPQEGDFDLGSEGNVVEAIVGIITRHPMSEEQLLHALASYPGDEKAKIIQSLKESNQAQVVERYGQRFWCASPSFFPQQEGQKVPPVIRGK